MINKTDISVVIPLYNKAPHIAKAIESVLQQTVKPFEIIVVDDGSTDDGYSVAEKFTNNNVRCIRQSNQGESAARNRGVNEARGQYIAFLDADDWWLPHHLYTLTELMIQVPDAILYSTSHLIERNGETYIPRSSYTAGWMGLVDNFFERYSIGLSLVNSITACVSRSELIVSGGFPQGIRRGPDIICWVKLALRGKVAHAEIPTAVYYQDAVNRTGKLRETEAPGSLQYLSELLRLNNISQNQRKGIERLFDRISFFTAAGFQIQSDEAGVNAIRKLAFSTGRYMVATEIRLISLIPPGLLYWAKRFRHRKMVK